MKPKQKLIPILIAVFLVFVLSRGASADILYFQVDLPTTGSVWNPGNTYTIHWYTKNTSGVNFPWVRLKLLLYPQGQLSNATVIGEFPINTDSTNLSWQVPPSTPAGKYVMRVQSRDEMTTYTNQNGQTTYTNKYGESGVFTIAKPATQAVLPGQPGWVPPNTDMLGSPVTAAPTSPSTSMKKDISGAKKYTASAQAKEFDIDRPGMDYESFDLSSPDPNLCERACKEDPQKCKAWTYVKPGVQGPKARCWLKSGIPQAVKNTSCISGIVHTPDNPQLTPIQIPAPVK